MRIPTATYRIQFNPSFGFDEAKGIVHYLSELGITDIYASPIFKARKGSLHGYDVVDPNQFNPQLGPMADFEELIRESKNHDMGWLQDIVPNHMAFDHENWMLMDVLENGLSSEYFHFFDIEWEHPYASIQEKLLAPFLGKFYGESLEEGEIKLGYDAGGFRVNYYDLIFPLRIESYARLLTHGLSRLRRELGDDHPDFIKLLGILYVLRTLPSEEVVEERYDQIKFIKRTLWELRKKNSQVKGFIDENIKTFNGKRGNPESFKLLDEILSEQFFRLSFWKVATEEINYRRFFNINELISLRVEDEDVFYRTHSLVLKLIQEGKITGLRVDHIDGLYDPSNYIKRLRDKAGGIYVIVEKILDLEECLPSFWAVQGTTGYDFGNYVNGVFCSRKNMRAFNRVYTTFTGVRISYDEIVSEKKRLIMGKHMAGDIDNLAHLLKTISSRDRYGSDIALYGLKRALVEIMALFPVYRTYTGQEGFSETDYSQIRMAVNKALQSNPGLANELRFIERFLLQESGDYLSEEEKKQRLHFVMRFQQFTGPLMAKGFEDTTLYVYNRLLSLNEVGGNPNKFGIPLKEFHDFNEKRLPLWPHSLNATSTHDTKRGEDVRARLNVLSEIPKEWERNLKTWSKINRRYRRKINDIMVPDRNDEYFLYQTLLGAFPFEESEYPLFIKRVKDYLIKAVREAKVHTAWLKPDTDYEDAFIAFVEEILSPKEGNPFLQEFLPFQKKISHYGIFNSLSQTLIKITAPGVPDFYQGTELWDLNLVDPDNRRPVDYRKRKAFLEEIRCKAETDILDLLQALLRTKEDGRIKLFLTYRALKARNENSHVFRNGKYVGLDASGPFGDHIIAFARSHGRNWAVTIAPRFFAELVAQGENPLGAEVWGDTQIALPEDAPGSWRDAITDQIIKSQGALKIGEVLNHFPVALILSEEDK